MYTYISNNDEKPTITITKLGQQKTVISADSLDIFFVQSDSENSTKMELKDNYEDAIGSYNQESAFNWLEKQEDGKIATNLEKNNRIQKSGNIMLENDKNVIKITEGIKGIIGLVEDSLWDVSLLTTYQSESVINFEWENESAYNVPQTLTLIEENVNKKNEDGITKITDGAMQDLDASRDRYSADDEETGDLMRREFLTEFFICD